MGIGGGLVTPPPRCERGTSPSEWGGGLERVSKSCPARARGPGGWGGAASRASGLVIACWYHIMILITV